MLLLPCALLALSAPATFAASILAPRDNTSNSSTVPAPISIPADNSWDGIDGQWSSFNLKVGTPEQTVRVFASFNSYQTLVVLPQGCMSAADVGSCEDTRGEVFDPDTSSSWVKNGIFDLRVDNNLRRVGNAEYGYDNVELPGQNAPTVKNLTVGGMAVTYFYQGLLGLDPRPSNWTTFESGAPSLMTMLKDQKSISSLSAGYTAGAKYRYSDGSPASLTLGGYDSSKFTENDVEFTLGADTDRNIVVGVQTINTPSMQSSSPDATKLLPNAIYASIDSSVAEIWLPEEACKAFESEFGLTYDNETQLYLVNDTLHDSLVKRNASITFQISQDATSGASVQIQLPYDAFDLTAQSPYQNLTMQSLYFPLRRAENKTQYTLGRTFLQEAYLTVDWESQRFNVSQVVWDQNAKQHLVAIPPYSGDSKNSDGSAAGGGNSGISTGAIAGIVVAVVVLVAIVVGLLAWRCIRRKKAAKARENEKLGLEDDGRHETVIPKAELEGSSPMASRAGRHRDSVSRNLLSAGNSTAVGSPGPESPNTPMGNGSTRGYFPAVHSPNEPSTPSGGEGTHSSEQSYGAPFSPIAPSSRSEADSKEKPAVFEMAGDMPVAAEKYGREYTEKEAIAHRERIYNGVDSAPTSAVSEAESPRELFRRVSPEDVVRASPDRPYLNYQQIMGPQSNHSLDPFSAGHQPAGLDSADVGMARTTSDARSPVSPLTGTNIFGEGTGTLHRAFSFERRQAQLRSEESTVSSDSSDLYK